MNLLFVIPQLGIGGAENQLAQLAVWLRKHDHDITVVSMLPATAHVEALGRIGVTVLTLGMSRGRIQPEAFLKLRRIVRQVRPDVLHGFGFPAVMITRVVSRLIIKGPAVVGTGVGTEEIVGNPQRRRLYRLTDGLSDATTHVSSRTAKMAEAAGAVRPGGIQWVPCGTDMASFKVPTDEERSAARSDLGFADEFLWVAVGRLVKEKDYSNLLQGFRLVSEREPGARLIIRGKGGLEQSLRDEIAQLGLGEVVQLWAQPEVDIPKLMKAADAYVLSSSEEGLPVVLVEAAACGLPMVSTEVGGTSDVVIPGETGQLVPARSPQELAEAMCHIIRMPEGERREMGRRGRVLAQSRFDMERVASDYEQVYNAALKRRRGA